MIKELESQTKNAIDFIDKLYFEVSCLIKEIEGILLDEDEQFTISKYKGYAVTNQVSTGLDIANVKKWLPKTFTVCFSPKKQTNDVKSAKANEENSRKIVIDVVLKGKPFDAPTIIAGCVWNIQNKKPLTYKNFENLLWVFPNYREDIFSKLPKVKHESSYIAFEGHFIKEPLFSIKDSDTILKKIVTPMLEQYRK